jgi:acetyl esterase/lipase
MLYDDSARLEQNARLAGVDVSLETWPGMWHVFQGFAPYVPESHQAIEKIGEFLRAHF